jgi:hypothetical protein
MGNNLSPGIDFEAWRKHLFPLDATFHARQWAFGFHDERKEWRDPQSVCGLHALACLQHEEVDGRIPWRGGERDWLRIPRAQIVGRSLELLHELGRVRGLLRVPDMRRPHLAPGTIALIGGDDGRPRDQWKHGGAAHVFVATGGDPTGLIESSEGGKIDARNGNFLTAIRQCVLEIHEPRRGSWWVREAGSSGQGRQLRWWYQAGDLPCIQGAP